jgi:hypothetical protein
MRVVGDGFLQVESSQLHVRVSDSPVPGTISEHAFGTCSLTMIISIGKFHDTYWTECFSTFVGRPRFPFTYID